MMCLSDVALNEFTKEEPVKAVLAEALNNAQNQFYSSFVRVMSLSSVTKLRTYRVNILSHRVWRS